MITIALKDDATIVSAYCTCVAGSIGSCKHSLASLFSLASFREGIIDRGPEVCTDVPCEWRKPRKESNPVLAEELDFRKNKTTPLPARATSQSFRPVIDFTEANQEALKDKVLEVLRTTQRRAVVLKAYSNGGSDDNQPQRAVNDALPTIADLACLYKKQQNINAISSADEFTAFCVSNLDKKLADIPQIPQGTPAWREQRLCRVTASISKNVVRFRQYHKPGSALIRQVTTIESIDSAQLRHGRQWEETGRQLFFHKWAQQHVNPQCHQTGLHVDQDLPYLAASPDGFLECDCHGTSVLEVKCTYKHWQSTLEEILDDPKYHFEPCGTIKKDSPWHWQVQTQLGVTRKQQAYLVLLHGQGKLLHEVSVTLDESMWRQVISKSKEFFGKCVLPLL